MFVLFLEMLTLEKKLRKTYLALDYIYIKTSDEWLRHITLNFVAYFTDKQVYYTIFI